MKPADLQPAPKGWAARLELDFEARHGRTVLARRRHHGPLLVQRSFPAPDGSCEAVLLHPPGGIVGGDRLELAVRVGPGAQARLTTPAAGKLYRSDRALALQAQSFTVAPGAALEWLPQLAILYRGARAAQHTRVDLGHEARFIGWELCCLGRPSAEDGAWHGDYRPAFELWQDGRPLLIERGAFGEHGLGAGSASGLRGLSVFGTLLACPAPAGDRAAELMADLRSDPALAVSCVDGVLAARVLGADGEAAFGAFRRAWQRLRPAVIGAALDPPRIWNT